MAWMALLALLVGCADRSVPSIPYWTPVSIAKVGALADVRLRNPRKQVVVVRLCASESDTTPLSWDYIRSTVRDSMANKWVTTTALTDGNGKLITKWRSEHRLTVMQGTKRAMFFCQEISAWTVPRGIFEVSVSLDRVDSMLLHHPAHIRIFSPRY